MPEFVNTRDTLGETAAFDALIADTLTELKDNVVSKLGGSALRYRKTLQSVELPSVGIVNNYALADSPGLKSVKLDAATELKDYVFDSDVALETVLIPACTKIGSIAFKGCEVLNTIDLAECLNLGNNAFEGTGVGKLTLPKVTTLGLYIGKGARMSTVDLTALTQIKANNFNGMGALVELILRNTSLVSLAASSALTGTPIASGIGYVYVPDNLVSTYKSASNWSSLSGQIKSLNDYPLAFQNETITDTWAQILAAEQDGTYSTKYSVGDIKYVDIGGTKYPMQIVAMDTDDLAAGGKAKITWIGLHQLCSRRMNAADTTTGGWAESEMREFLREGIYPQIESTVRNAIKPVTKTYRNKTPNDTTLSITDTVWIPSYREMFGGTSYDGSGCLYSSFFTTSASKIKKQGQGGTASIWWLRSGHNYKNFTSVTQAGASYSYAATGNYGVVLGFCT